ncbi:MAG: hypothetical protein GQ582_05295 [Methyloprofundus sp.]|nr:hypothetical protein [Methyloprofundus sp.]
MSWTTYKKVAGLTLVELLVSTVISLFLLLGVFQLLLNLGNTTLTTTSLSSYQESGRFATEFMVREIRQSGLLGNLSDIKQISPTIADPIADASVTESFSCDKAWVWQLSAPIYGYDDTLSGVSSILDCMSSNSGSDVLIYRGSDDRVTATADLQDDHDYLYSNFSVGTLFRKNVDTTPTSATGFDFWEVKTKILYIKNDPAGVPSLYQYDSSSSSSEQIIDGVESMQISYGLRSDIGDFVKTYVTAPSFSDAVWDQVSTLQIDLLVRSLSPNSTYQKAGACLDNANTYTLGNYTYTPTDTAPNCYYRRVFTTIVQLRNGE